MKNIIKMNIQELEDYEKTLKHNLEQTQKEIKLKLSRGWI